MHTDGTILLYSIGMDPEGKPKSCKGAAAAPPAAPQAHGAELIELHYATSPGGPWTQLLVPGASFGGRNLFDGTNPAPWVLPNGTVVVASHGADVVASTTGAADWRGPYSKPRHLFSPPADATKMEDPYLWFDESPGIGGRWRVLLHQYNGSAPHPQYRVGEGAGTCGCTTARLWM